MEKFEARVTHHLKGNSAQLLLAVDRLAVFLAYATVAGLVVLEGHRTEQWLTLQLGEPQWWEMADLVSK